MLYHVLLALRWHQTVPFALQYDIRLAIHTGRWHQPLLLLQEPQESYAKWKPQHFQGHLERNQPVWWFGYSSPVHNAWKPQAGMKKKVSFPSLFCSWALSSECWLYPLRQCTQRCVHLELERTHQLISLSSHHLITFFGRYQPGAATAGGLEMKCLTGNTSFLQRKLAFCQEWTGAVSNWEHCWFFSLR